TGPKGLLGERGGPPGGGHTFGDINLLGHEASYAGARAVDPANPNVVYVGGSRRFTQPGDPPAHALLRIDTGNMRDTTFAVAGAIPNDGDDITKAAQGGFYNAPFNTDPYTGEGVFWFDLEQGQSGGSGPRHFLPAVIHAIAFDAQGRLLFATEGGPWRGVSRGFGYDLGSGGAGIVRAVGFNPVGMTFTSLNGNLQITDVTSAALDPLDPGRILSTQAGGGTSLSTGPLQWQTT